MIQMMLTKYSNNAMKTINRFILVAFAATSIVACQKEEADQNDVAPKGEVVTFTGSVNVAETKTAIHYTENAAEFPTLFTSSDVIAVNGVKSKANILNDETGESDYKDGVSVSKDQHSITFDVEGVTGPYYAVTGAHYKKDYSEGVYPLQISGTGAMQKFRTVAGGEYVSFHSSSDILAAYSETESFQFKHMTTFYAITIDSENSTVKDNIRNIYVRQGDGSKIAGNWKLTFEGESHTPALTPTNLTAFIGYDCGDAGVAQGTTMIVGLPAYDYESGLIFTIKDVNGKFASYKVAAERTQHASDGGVIIPFKPAFKPGAGVINSADDWNEFAAFVNNTPANDWEIYRWIGDGSNTIKLGKDIEAEDLDPITVDFTYTLDGNGKTITRTNATSALFSTVSGEVKNLTLAGTLTLTDEGAPLVNTLAAGGKVTDCKNKMTVTFEADDHAYVGGLVKIMQGGVIEGCTNEGEITVNLDLTSAYKNTAVAGIVAQINASSNDVTVKNSLNKGAITLAPISSGKGMKVCGLGGIVGWIRAAGAITLDNCDNEGNVTFSSESVTSTTGTEAYDICVGGVIGIGAPQNTSGYLITPTAENGFDITLSNCDNKGTVYNCASVYVGYDTSTKKQTNKRVFTAGLAGSLLGKEADYASLVSCTNTGAVYTYDLTGEGASTQPCYSSVCGGFVGFGGYLDMNDCTVNCTMGNGKRPVMSYGGVIGCAVMPFSLKNSNVFVEGFYQRITNYQGNRAVVASVPVLFGTTATNTMNIAPAISGSTISNCKIGASVNTSDSALSTANGEKTDDCSESLTTTIFNSETKTRDNLVCGQGYTAVEGDVTVTGYTYWTGN